MRTRHTTLVVALLGLCAFACAVVRPGCASAAEAAVPPAPDYAREEAWAAWPGRPSGADTVPPGLADAALPDDQKVDVFFIHPTTYLANDKLNARYDEPGLTRTRIDRGVLRFQASAFNACCHIYAPRYRQAAFGTFMLMDVAASEAAYELAYGDVARAFDYYVAHENHGRPFIIASHSQGSLHAMRLLQQRIAGAPLARQLVAAYVIGYYIPEEIEQAGVAVCRSAQQTGCLVDWNTMSAGVSDARRESSRLIWLNGRYQSVGGRKMVCTNPLNWIPDADAPASLNLGALPAVRPGGELRAPLPQLTGARCVGAALQVSIPADAQRGFSGMFSFFGSYHLFDYNLFYTNIRVNAKQRVSAYRAAQMRQPA
jgi:Protein of unknown function (DUF3089)